METGSPSTLLIILGILAAPILLILVAYGLVVLWRKQCEQAIRDIGACIQEHDNQLGEIHQFVNKYAAARAEPYITSLDTLEAQASDAQSRLETFLTASREFELEVHAGGFHSLQGIINAPFAWFRRWRYSADLQKECDTIAAQIAAANGQIEAIRQLPWDLAEQCRTARGELGEISQAADTLQRQSVRGEALRAIQKQLPILAQALDEIPPRFYEMEKEALLAATSQRVTIQVFEIYQRVRPAIERYRPQVQEWLRYYERANTEFADLKLAGASLRQAITTPPEGLVITALQSRLDQTAQMAADISQRLSQPEAEDLKALSREITQLRRVVQDTEHMLARSSQQAGALSQSLSELQQGLDSLAGQFGALERGGTFPLVWDRSGPQASDLRRRLEALGPVSQPRTPEEIAQHLKEVESIRSRYSALANSYPGAAEQYRALAALLESPELKEGAAWYRKSREMLSQAALYDPRNWPKGDAVQMLPDELDALVERQDRLVPVDRSAAVVESDLARRLEETQKLAALHKSLRPRVESVRARLAKIQSLEAQGKDRLNESYHALERVLLLTESNDLLDEIASSEVPRLQDEIRQSMEDLNARAQGEVEKKLQKVQALTDKANRALNGWLAQLNASIVEQGKEVSDRLVQLDSVGSLDEEPVISAHSLLARDEYLSAQRGPASDSSTAGRLRHAVLQRQPLLGDLEATAEIKRKSDFWLRLLAAKRAMEETTGSLLAAYQEAVQARSEARERAAEVTKRAPTRRTWPPNNQPPLEDAQLLAPIDERWEMMKKGTPRRIDTAVLELGRLTQQYRLAAERAGQVLNRLDQDEERVKDLEEEIGDLKQRWQSQAQADPTNQVIREGVQHLMSKADERLSFIRQQYMRGALSYEETIHNLRLLNDELYSARVPVDEKNDIGLNETPRRIGMD